MPRFFSAVFFLVSCLFTVWCSAEEANFHVYLGTYTGGTSEGIYVAKFDATTGKLADPKLAAAVKNPSFLAIHPQGKYLYAVNETADYKKQNVGAISAFAIQADGSLKFLNDKSSGGAGPCHVVVDKEGRHVLAANYGGGSVCAYSLTDQGELKEQTGFVQHTGSSVNPARQKEPHAHSINLSADNRFAFVADLGLDKILIYKFDAQSGALAANEPPFGLSPAGGGPRHFAFNPTRPMAYANNEMLSSVTAYTYDAKRGELVPTQTITTLPPDASGAHNSTAEVCVHPQGKFVYVSNRGHNSIAVFSVEEKTGRLISVGHQATGINVPRNFCLDPTGKWALVANQQGNSVLVFSIDAATGMLQPTDQKIEVGNPVCVRFLKLQ
jgi:6-phosphogluconolactonase